MGLIWEIIKTLGEDETEKEKKKQRDDKLFEDEAQSYGLTEFEKKECKKAGITPEEWAEDNEEDGD
jgi:hypothetical protein